MAAFAEAAPYVTSDKSSFAYFSARDRWPIILTSAIDDVHRSISNASDPVYQAEGKAIVEQLAKLKYDVQHDRPLTPIPDDGEADIAGYNQELKQLGTPTWFNVPWLFSECYLYRRLHSIFTLSNSWKSYDVFYKQKMSTFKSSRAAVIELAARYKLLDSQLDAVKDDMQTQKSMEEKKEAERLLFIEMCEICLWGNATDLSLLTSLTYEDIQKLQGSKARKEQEKNIIVNDLPKAYEILKTAKDRRQASRQVDIILDNAGFELYVDLILAGYLLASGLATHIILHPKSIPWFVSDVLPADFAALLNVMQNPQAFFTTPSDDDKHTGTTPSPLSQDEVDLFSFLFESWSKLHQEGKLIIRPNRFWTQGCSYWSLPQADPDLFSDLKDAELCIFKGDLNYRKLTKDAMWDPTTPFAAAIGPLGPGSGIRSIALRTCKADVVVGLPQGEDERLRAMEGGGGDSGARKWAWSGKWAVVEFCDGKA